MPDPRDCENFALLECVDHNVCLNVLQHFERLRHGTLQAQNNTKILICEVSDDCPEKFVVVLFNGNLLSGYSAFFTWCEARLHQVSLIRVGSYESVEQLWDPLNIGLMQERRAMLDRNSYFVYCERNLVKTFISQVVLGNYTENSLCRVVEMCCLGPDPNHACVLLMGFLQRWKYSPRDVDCWVRIIREGHTKGWSGSTWTDGSNLVTRVMAHLIYAEEMLPTPRGLRRKLRKQGIQKMSLDSKK